MAPKTFKNVVGKGHSEFSTMKQQDALEYFQYLMTLIERDEHKREGGKFDPSKIFKFKLEERIQDTVSLNVKYSYREDNVLPIPIPVEKCSNLGIFEFLKTFNFKNRRSKRIRNKKTK